MKFCCSLRRRRVVLCVLISLAFSCPPAHTVFRAFQQADRGDSVTASEVRTRATWKIDYVIPWSGESIGDYSGINRDDKTLQHVIRSVLTHLDWINTVFIFADPQTRKPEWLDAYGSRVTLIDRCKNFIGGRSNCPTENTFAVYANIHTIDGLGERYIVCDDDVIITARLSPDMFFDNTTGRAALFFGAENVALYPGMSERGGVKTVSSLANNRTSETTLPSKIPKQSISRMHAPWPCIRSAVVEMAQEYMGWFEFVSSHRTRFCLEADLDMLRKEGKLNKNGSCYRENTAYAIMWYMSVTGRVVDSLRAHPFPSRSISRQHIVRGQLLQTLQNTHGTVNLNDPAFLSAEEIKLFNEDEAVRNGYIGRVAYVEDALQKFLEAPRLK